MATDADFHVAGDGRLGGVVRPHDGKCYLEKETDKLFTYTKSKEFDYPSVFQINDNLIKNDIVPLFAVTDRQQYDRLVSNDTVSIFYLDMYIYLSYSIICNIFGNNIYIYLYIYTLYTLKPPLTGHCRPEGGRNLEFARISEIQWLLH